MVTAHVSAEGLAAVRGERILFKDVSVSATAGDAIVLRGANGAGKTTLLRILAGLTRPAAGRVNCSVPFHWQAHRLGLKPHETPHTHLQGWARAWGSETDLPLILNEVGLRRPAGVPARYLSAGQRQRTALARLLLDERALWLMDEPFSALDVDGRAMLLKMLAAHRERGGAIIAAIHGEAGFEATNEVVL